MERQPTREWNRARVSGWLTAVRQRWTPDGSLAMIGSVLTARPALGPVRAAAPRQQPIPLRAQGDIAERLLSLEGEYVLVEGCLRRRFYSRDGEPCWGQLEIWVDQCRKLEIPLEQTD